MEAVDVLYTCEVDPEITSESPDSFREKIQSTLGDPRGWVKYGYNFVYVQSRRTTMSQSERVRHPPSVDADGADHEVMKIILVSGDKAKNKCGSRLGGFSCYSPDENNIYMNLNNWMGGSASTLPLDRYRTYAINHEVGHRLGLGHPSETNCSTSEFCNANKGAPGSVMIQMTRGADWVRPCVENEWPLDPSVYNELEENPHLSNTYTIPFPTVTGGGGNHDINIVVALLILMIVLLMAIFDPIVTFVEETIAKQSKK